MYSFFLSVFEDMLLQRLKEIIIVNICGINGIFVHSLIFGMSFHCFYETRSQFVVFKQKTLVCICSRVIDCFRF